MVDRADVIASPALEQLQLRLQYRFIELARLQDALTHRSFSAQHNERLEFLGDSVLNLAVAHLLFERLSELPEGDLSRIRANLVRQDTLHQLAVMLELPALLRLGEGEVRSGGRSRPSILADALEAIIGAVYLDGGPLEANALIRRLFSTVEIHSGMAALQRDAKTGLQELLQSRRLPVPGYRVVGTAGAAHQQIFTVECAVPALGATTLGDGASRRAAEQAAAAAMWKKLKDEHEKRYQK